jgi:AcrR family transcriptional regulator
MVVLLPLAAVANPMASHQSVPNESSRDRLLQSAKRLFAQQGYEQTATSAIARQAGTSESQLMRYFGGKIGLLETLFSDAWNDLNTRIRAVKAESASSRQLLLDVLETITIAFAKDPDLATLLLFESRRLRGQEPRLRTSPGFAAFADVTRGLVRRGQADREFDSSLDAAAITSALIGAAEGMIRDRIVARASGGRAFAEREVRRTLEAILDGFVRKATRMPRGTRSAKRRRSR